MGAAIELRDHKMRTAVATFLALAVIAGVILVCNEISTDADEVANESVPVPQIVEHAAKRVDKALAKAVTAAKAAIKTLKKTGAPESALSMAKKTLTRLIHTADNVHGAAVQAHKNMAKTKAKSKLQQPVVTGAVMRGSEQLALKSQTPTSVAAALRRQFHTSATQTMTFSNLKAGGWVKICCIKMSTYGVSQFSVQDDPSFFSPKGKTPATVPFQVQAHFITRSYDSHVKYCKSAASRRLLGGGSPPPPPPSSCAKLWIGTCVGKNCCALATGTEKTTTYLSQETKLDQQYDFVKTVHVPFHQSLCFRLRAADCNTGAVTHRPPLRMGGLLSVRIQEPGGKLKPWPQDGACGLTSPH